MQPLKKEIIDIGRWIWQKNLTAGPSGNISVRAAKDKVLITGHGACMGALQPEDIGGIDFEGRPLEESFKPSVEKAFHLSVYKNLEASCVIHLHPAFSNGFFISRDSFEPDTFEARLVLGHIPVIEQKTPAIVDINPVIAALKNSNIVVLKYHGVVACGQGLRETFFLIQELEEAVKSACVKKLMEYSGQRTEDSFQPSAFSLQRDQKTENQRAEGKKYVLFSEEQIKEIVRLVNSDEKFRALSCETKLATKLAVVLEETKSSFCFNFKDGGISEYKTSLDEAEFVISGRAEYWRAIFNRQLDPFAATTQKKLKLKGDFAKISRWYVPFNRLFELWQNVPVE